MTFDDLEPGMIFLGRSLRNWSEGRREIVSMTERRVEYRILSPGAHHRRYTCSMAEFLEWIVLDVTEGLTVAP